MHRPIVRLGLVSALLPLLLVAAPRSLAAQDYIDQVWRQLQVAYNELQDDYWLDNYVIGNLDHGETDTWTWTFHQEDSYAIFGACDQDCTDLDIEIQDAYGNIVVRDVTNDDVPFVRFSPSRTGDYTMKVNMYTCSDEPCYFGFGIFHR